MIEMMEDERKNDDRDKLRALQLDVRDCLAVMFTVQSPQEFWGAYKALVNKHPEVKPEGVVLPKEAL